MNSLNPLFLTQLEALGPQAHGLAEALTTTEPSVAVRVNADKGAMVPPDADKVAWCNEAFYLAERPLFAADPAWHQGRYYVQEASSMASEAAMRAIVALIPEAKSLRILDACAAPGGKTMGILEAAGKDAFIVANEFEKLRANILAENIAKRGAANCAISLGPAQAFAALPEAFDIIAADVPCSGEGMMRKDAVAVSQWTPALVEHCAALQRDIITALWTALKPGGFLLYSTCTFNRSENEENIEYIIRELGGESVALGLDAYKGVETAIGSNIHAYRFFPGRVRGEGLFIAAVRKPGEGSDSRYPAAGKEDTAARKFIDSYLTAPAAFAARKGSVNVEAVPRQHDDFVATLRKKVRLLRGGLPTAELKGRDLVPVNELALSTIVRPNAIPEMPLDYTGAMAYLRGEALSDIPDGTPRGYIAPSFDGCRLGLAKCVGRRANNLYPTPLRLRLNELPSTPPKVL